MEGGLRQVSSTDLPWLVFGRKVRPYALWLSMATATVAWSLLTHRAVGAALDGVAGIVIGCVAATAVALLWVGYLVKRDGWMRTGLLAAAGAWFAVGVFLALEGVSPVSAILAFCWAGASAGAYLPEAVANVGTYLPKPDDD